MTMDFWDTTDGRALLTHDLASRDGAPHPGYDRTRREMERLRVELGAALIALGGMVVMVAGVVVGAWIRS